MNGDFAHWMCLIGCFRTFYYQSERATSCDKNPEKWNPFLAKGLFIFHQKSIGIFDSAPKVVI
jgi:hypothetical protein